MDPLTVALAAGGTGIATGISELITRAQERKIDESIPGQLTQQQLSDAAKRAATGQYGLSEAQRLQTQREIAAPARAEIDRNLSLLGSLRRGGVGRSGAADKQAVELVKAGAQIGADAGGKAAEISQKTAESQKIADVGLTKEALKNLVNRLNARRRARREAAAMGLKLGAAAGGGIRKGAVATTEASGVTKSTSDTPA